MNKQLFFSIALLASVFSAGAMHKNHAPVAAKKVMVASRCANGRCGMKRTVVTPAKCVNGKCAARPAVKAPIAVAKAPVLKVAAKAPALAQVATRKVGCANGRCGMRRPAAPAHQAPIAKIAPKPIVINKVAPKTQVRVVKAAPKAPAVTAPKALKFGCANGKCAIKRPVVKQGGCANGKCNLKPKNK